MATIPVTITDITSNGATFDWSSFQNYDSTSYFQYSLNDTSWSYIGSITSVSIKNLNGNTRYTFYVRLINGNGNIIAIGQVTFTTLSDQSNTFIKVNGVWKKGKAFFKKDGKWVKIKKLYQKSNGIWRVNKS